MKFLCTIWIALLLLAGCSLPRGAAISSEVLREQDAKVPGFAVVPVNRGNVAQLASWPATGWKGGYHWLSGGGGDDGAIQPGDMVNLVVWDNQENSLLISQAAKKVDLPAIEVSARGTVFVPYLGDVVVSGQSAELAREHIQKRMATIAPSAQVQLSVTPGLRNSVDLVSGVGKPGSYPLRDRNYSILSLLAEGGGIAGGMKNPLVRLMRQNKTYEIRAETLFSDAGRNTILRGGDKVLVREDDRYFTALGATGSERLIPFEKNEISALEAMSMVGGIADNRANPKGVLVLREYAAKAVRADGVKGPTLPHVVFTFDLTSADGLFAARNFRINPKDTVLATESPMVAATTIFGLLGSVIRLNNAVR